MEVGRGVEGPWSRFRTSIHACFGQPWCVRKSRQDKNVHASLERSPYLTKSSMQLRDGETCLHSGKKRPRGSYATKARMRLCDGRFLDVARVLPRIAQRCPVSSARCPVSPRVVPRCRRGARMLPQNGGRRRRYQDGRSRYQDRRLRYERDIRPRRTRADGCRIRTPDKMPGPQKTCSFYEKHA